MEKYLPTQYQQFIYLSRYSRFLWEEKRRETWEETVNRYFDFFENTIASRQGYRLSGQERQELEQAVLTLQVMPSMRALSTAGTALERDEVAGYNCSYLAIDNIRAFDEILYILMCGTGVGFSVERQYINKLPDISEEFHNTETTIVVRDSKVGWAKAFKELIALLYNGQIPNWDLSALRPAGAPLKTFGGRSSGPEPLDDLFRFAVTTFRNAAGRKLNSLECHDLVCKTGDTVVSGGVRRSALISLSNLSDDRMRTAKSGKWWENNVQRALANNSACYTEHPDMGVFIDEWKSLYDSKSGERGIFNRVAAKKQSARNGRRNYEVDFGCNPCGEILLRSKQFCNLTEVVVRASDTEDTLMAKVKVATILGTMQSALTNFRYIRKEWRENCEEERLLGVSFTGVMDSNLTNIHNTGLAALLQRLRDYSVEVNDEWAAKLKINPSTAITCVKPSGTVSQLTDSASGLHTRYSNYYVRTVRADISDPLAEMMIAAGFPYERDATKPDRVYVFSFPVKAPSNSIFRNDLSAVQQLDFWKIYKDNWCEHNPSVTVYVKENEWLDVGAWVYKNFDGICGITLLPHTEHIYKQAPYQEITQDQYEAMISRMPSGTAWSSLTKYENTDTTTNSGLTACVGGVCEIVDITKNG